MRARPVQRQGHAPACRASPVLPPPPASGGRRDRRQEAPVPPLRPLGWRTPLAGPPPPRPGTTRAARIRPFRPRPPPPPPCSS
ncbi:hypothetical protein BS78_01G180100 [Paspalum vaginatum]|nr:hypothetical protein BS78_01G180100 [Paspalum vaginatum]